MGRGAVHTDLCRDPVLSLRNAPSPPQKDAPLMAGAGPHPPMATDDGVT